MPRRRGTTVTGVVLDVVDDDAFEGPMERWDIADGQRGTVAAVDELARVHARTLLMESVARRPQLMNWPMYVPGRCRWRAWRGDRSSTCSRAKQRL